MVENDAPSRAEEFESVLAPLRQQFEGRIKAYPVGKYGVLVVRYCRNSERKILRMELREAEKAKNEDQVDLTDENLVIRCAVYPDQPTVKQIIEDYPGIVSAAAAGIMQLSGEGIRELGKG